MSHSYDSKGGTRFICNGDFSGDVRVLVPQEGPEGPWYQEAEVPFADLRELVFTYLRGRRIERAEQATDDEFESDLLGGRA